MKIDAERLRGFLDCMHDEADERDKRSAQIRDIVKTAKEAGYDTKAVRKVFARERMDEAERSKQDDLLETYEGALGGKGRALRAIAAGVPVGEACAANGVHRATVARARHGDSHVAKPTSNATPHDPETGEINESCGGGDPSVPGSAEGVATTSSGDARVPSGPQDSVEQEAERLGLTGVVAILEARREAEDRPAISDDEVIALAEAATAAIDDLTLPSFLKRERVA